jgi:hypothetical protein
VVNGDVKVELNETVIFTLSNPVNASILNGTGSGTITNDDDAVITITSPSIDEGDVGTQNLVFDISMSNPSDANVSFNYTTNNGTATIADNDYVLSNGAHTLTPGQTTKQVSVVIEGDCIIEPDENFYVDLNSLSNAGRDVTFFGGGSTLSGTGTIENDDAAPLITCPDNTTISCDESTLPANTGGMATATDNCSPSPTIGYTDVITPGICATSYTITRTWKATDGTNDMTTCDQIITVVDDPPSAVCMDITIELDDDGNASIAPGDVDDGSSDACGSVTLVSVEPNTFTCGDAGENIVTLTVMDECGSTSTCTSTVTIGGGDLYKYVIASIDGSKLEKNNIVHSGGVGATASKGKVEVKMNSLVTASGTFVEAKNITVDNSSAVTVKILSPAVIPIPSFQYNTLSTTGSPNVTVPDNGVQVIAGSVFNKIKIGKNATVTFTNQDINVLMLEVKDNATLQFSSCAIIRAKEAKFDKNLNFNPDGFDVWLFSEKMNVDIKEGSDVVASVYALKEINASGKPNNRTSMTGIFIGKKVDGSDGVDWYANTQCNNGCILNIPRMPELKVIQQVVSVDEGIELNAFPNPFNNEFTINFNSRDDKTLDIRIYDVTGKAVFESLKVNPFETFTTGSQLDAGVFILEITQGEFRKAIRIIKAE